ncbi:MAG: very short patch repair endonuclease [Treponema sp.]|jgi:hypothetical protein|nr:very short patch repair endonuclease [Treponema sp.]
MGWVVIRFWGKEIKKNPMNCVNEIKETIYEITHGLSDEYNEASILISAEDEPEYDSENDKAGLE